LQIGLIGPNFFGILFLVVSWHARWQTVAIEKIKKTVKRIL
jgi:hypothetical protein